MTWQVPTPLQPLTRYPQWIDWRVKADGDKIPVNPHTGEAADVMNPAHRAASGRAFVLTPDDPFFCVDLDNCWTGSEWSPLAVEMCGRFAGAAVEVSQSGRGLHIIGSARHIPPHRTRSPGVELYSANRFLALTGTNAVGSADTDCTEALASLIVERFTPDAAGDMGDDWRDGPVPEWSGPEDDDALIASAYRSRSAGGAFGAKVTFAQLWDADEAALGRAYPDDHGARPYDASGADSALAQHLAFWTGKDHARIDRLMRRSALARDKWDREDYLPRTVRATVARQRDVLQSKRESETASTDGSTYVTIDRQPEHFQGCVYVSDHHKVLVPGGRMLKPEQFRVSYGGYVYPLDAANSRVTRNAWDVVCESEVLHIPRVDTAAFRPTMDPSEVFEEDGRRVANTYWPIPVRRMAGDAAPFLQHVAKLLPDEGDREAVLNYMAAVVQYPGVKFQWAPIIQGVEGNGKTLLSRVTEYAVGREYTHWADPNDIDNHFNAWLYGKILICIEDIYVTDRKASIMEVLKPMITNDRQPITPKGVDQAAKEVCANMIFNSNHRDAIRKTQNDRRFAPFFTPQQEHTDLSAWGMSGDYFPRLYRWLKADGYAIVADYLHTKPIPDALNPAQDCTRAPDTTSTRAAIAASTGRVEQEVLEAIDQGRPGFCGGWISSMALDKLLKDSRLADRVPPNKRRDMLKNLGYDYHPGLPDGRVHNCIMPDNGKPRLFIADNSPDRLLNEPWQISKNYSLAQNATGAFTSG